MVAIGHACFGAGCRNRFIGNYTMPICRYGFLYGEGCIANGAMGTFGQTDFGAGGLNGRIENRRMVGLIDIWNMPFSPFQDSGFAGRMQSQSGRTSREGTSTDVHVAVEYGDINDHFNLAVRFRHCAGHDKNDMTNSAASRLTHILFIPIASLSNTVWQKHEIWLKTV